MIERVFGKWYTAFIAAFVMLFFFYHKVLINLNGYVFAPGGDGIKNYYTYMFQAKYGTSFWEFKGMNYPFYEHIVFTDAHPLLAFIVGKLGLADYGVGILNFLMLISYPIAAVLIHFLLKHYKVSNVWALLGALSICFLSPQIFRLTGHLSLSYVFAIPLMWCLILKTEQSRSAFWPILIFVILFVFFFTHPYLGLILAVFGLFYVLVNWLFEKGKWKVLGLKLVLPILSAIGFFQLLITNTDTHIDRMKTPTGFFDMYALWNSLLVPHHGPMNKVKHALNWRMSSWESWTYLGLFVILIIVFTIAYYFLNRKDINLKSIVNTPVGKMYLVGHLVLMFAFCFPLKFDFLRWIVEVLGALQQFRVLGRFAWVYFYVASILSIVVLYRIMLKSDRKIGFQVFFFVGIFFSLLEFYPAHKGVAKAISTSKNPFIFQNLSQDEQELISWTKAQEDYNAVIFLPFTHLSSENIFLLGSEKASYHSFLLSYHANIPLLNTVSSRTSVTEAIAFHNLFSPEFVEKTFQRLLPDTAKIMMVKNRAVLDPNELRMSYSTKGVWENDEFNVHHLDFNRWNNPKYFKAVNQLNDSATFFLNDGWRADTSDVDFIYESFEDLKEERSFYGEGALAGQKNGFHVIKNNLHLNPGDYVCNFWYNFRIDRADQEAVIEQVLSFAKASKAHKQYLFDAYYLKGNWLFIDSAFTVSKWVSQNDIRQSNHIVGDWLLVEMPFTVTGLVESTSLILSGNRSKKWFIIDELLIRKAWDRPLFKEATIDGEPYFIYNNYWLWSQSFSE